MIAVGTIVRGNWSKIEYRADHVWKAKGQDYWCINGKDVTNKLSSGSFSMLGERKGNSVSITDPNRPNDRLIIVREPKEVKRRKQMEFNF